MTPRSVTAPPRQSHAVSASVQAPEQLMQAVEPATKPQGFNRSSTESGPVISCLHILVAEDSPPVRTMLVRGLRRKGHTVTPAQDGEEGLAAWMRDPLCIDAIVSDMTMPNMCGDVMVECIAKECRDRGVDVPVVVGVTGNVLDDDVERFRAAGAGVVMAKPVSIRAILAEVGVLLQQAGRLGACESTGGS